MTNTKWPFPKLRSEYILAFGLLLLALCLFPFWGAIATAAVFSFGLKRPLDRLRARFHFGKKFMGVLALLFLFLSLMLPLSYLGLRLYQIALGNKEKGVSGAFSAATLSQATSAYQNLEEKVARLGSRWNFYEDTASARASIQESLANAGKAVFAAISASLLALPDLVVTTIVFFIFLYLFLSRSRQIAEGLVKIGAMSAPDVKKISDILQSSSQNSLVSNMVVGAIQASLIAIGARIFGFTESVVIFTVVFFLSFVPVIGAAPVAFALAIVAFLSGQTGQGIGMTVVGLIGGTIDNVVRPYLVSDAESEVHPVLSFSAILGAIAIFGLKGLFLGPVILTASFALLLSQKESEK